MKRQVKPGTMLNPVPVCMVTCQREGERPNIITIAWTGTVCSDPPMVYISVRKGRHSHAIISQTGEFVINLPSVQTVRQTDWCGVKSGRDVDKFAECGLTPEAACVVGAPLIAECPVALECRVTQVLELGSHDMFLAEVVSVSVDEGLFDSEGKIDLEKAGLICYVHGEYFGLHEALGFFGFSVARRTGAVREQAREAARANRRLGGGLTR